MRYGYYAAATRTRYGDPECSRLARLLWRLRGHRHPSRVDGASVWVTDAGVLETHIVARDLFGDATVRFPRGAPFTIPKVLVAT